MVQSESGSTSVFEALRRRTGNIKYDERPIRGKDAAVRLVRGSEMPSPRKLVGFLGKAAAYYGVEAYKARFNGPQAAREGALIRFARQHEGVRGVIARAFRLSIHPVTSLRYDHQALAEVLGSSYDDVVTTTWNASVSIPKGRETPFGPLTPELLTKVFHLGMKAVAGFNEEELERATNVSTSHKVDEKHLYDMAVRGQIDEGDLERLGDVEETWVVRPTPQLAGAPVPGEEAIVQDAGLMPLQL